MSTCSKGVVLAGGKGTRLGELTKVTNKHLLPVGEWPMIYYPIKKLIGIGIVDIMLITGDEHVGDFIKLLGSGDNLGCNLTYKVQSEAAGIADALALAENFCGDCCCYVILGDNIFYDPLPLIANIPEPGIAHVFLKRVKDPRRFGVATLDENTGLIVEVEEKPSLPRSNLALAGIYHYPADVFSVIEQLTPSARNEYEITDVNSFYCTDKRLYHFELEGYWTDAGTHESLLLANNLVSQVPPIFTPRKK